MIEYELMNVLYDFIVKYDGYINKGNFTQNSNIVTNIIDTSKINIGDVIISDNIQQVTFVVSKNTNSITLSNNVNITGIAEFATHENNIFVGNVNNNVLPKNNNFIVITDLNTSRIFKSPIIYNDTENEKITIQNLYINQVQLDIYGDDSITKLKKIINILDSYIGYNFFREYNSSIVRLYDIINLTNVLDTEQYLLRYCLKIDFNINSINELDVKMTDKINIITTAF